MKLTEEQYNQLVPLLLQRYDNVVPSFKLYKRASNGVFDYSAHQTRVLVYEGFGLKVATRMWIESPEHASLLPDWMQLPWGTYPDIPTK